MPTSINGNNFNNILSGLDGNDTLNGHLGNDSLSGGNGNDVLAGGAGIDSMNGGAGFDRFLFANRGPANADTIVDFNHAADTIVLSNALDTGLLGAISPGVLGLAFNGGNVPGNQLSSSWFFKGSGADGNGAGALSGIYVNTFNGQIWYNPTTAAGGDSALLGRVAVATAPTLDATDFVYGV